ncbi:hypothetical protein VPARA_24240 [Variovorax paradoxus]|uniref:Uncharacterized protein n=1 Tax=Variovorax paradoxus TaxID=34073 RepID=A0A0H2M6V5_VARPD|nr:hypothetical protein VPARA_24240 [Variovorax paradoxus]
MVEHRDAEAEAFWASSEMIGTHDVGVAINSKLFGT